MNGKNRSDLHGMEEKMDERLIEEHGLLIKEMNILGQFIG